MYYLLSIVIKYLTPTALIKVANVIGWIFYRLFPYRKAVIKTNIGYLKYVDPDLETEDLVLPFYQHMTAMFMENLMFYGLPEPRMRDYIEVVTPEVISQIKKEEKAVIISGHLGNWEVMASALGLIVEQPVYFVTKRIKNPVVNRFIHSMRQQYGNKMILMHKSMEVMKQRLADGGLVAMVGDQSAPEDSYWGLFLGQPVPIFLGAAVLALKNRAPLYFLVSIRREDGRFDLMGEKIRTDDLDPSDKNSIYVLTQRHTQVLETYIRRYPVQYYWIHKRWKHTHKANDYYPQYHPDKPLV